MQQVGNQNRSSKGKGKERATSPGPAPHSDTLIPVSLSGTQIGTSMGPQTWGGSFCFPLMAPPVTPERDVTAILVASQRVCASHVPDLRELGPDLRQARQEL